MHRSPLSLIAKESSQIGELKGRSYLQGDNGVSPIAKESSQIGELKEFAVFYVVVG